MTLEPNAYTLLYCALGANFGIGLYHLLLVLETIKESHMKTRHALFLGFAYASPPTLIVLALARLAGII